MTQRRGNLTDRIKAKSKAMLGYEITQLELRLMAYAQYVMMNEQKLDISKIVPDEREIISKWRERGFMEGGASGMAITKEFWDAMCEILWLGYVDLSE